MLVSQVCCRGQMVCACTQKSQGSQEWMQCTSLILGSVSTARTPIWGLGMRSDGPQSCSPLFPLFMAEGMCLWPSAHSVPSFFQTKTTAVHQRLVLGLMAPVSCISSRCCLTSLTIKRGMHWKCSLNSGLSSNLILCSNSLCSKGNTLWYFNRSQCTSSA